MKILAISVAFVAWITFGAAYGTHLIVGAGVYGTWWAAPLFFSTMLAGAALIVGAGLWWCGVFRERLGVSTEPRCTTERECDHQPWCRINGRCEREAKGCCPDVTPPPGAPSA